MRERRGEHPFGDAGQLIFLGVFLIVWVGDSFFLHISTFLTSYIPLIIRLFVLGLALITAILLVRSGHIVISNEQRPEGLVTDGVFRYVRHPLYLASILTYLGLTVSTLSLISFVFFLVIFIFHNYIATYEEKFLEEQFGEEYREYKRKTGKWIPGIH